MFLQEARLLPESQQRCWVPVTWAQIPAVPAAESLERTESRLEGCASVEMAP